MENNEVNWGEVIDFFSKKYIGGNIMPRKKALRIVLIFLIIFGIFTSILISSAWFSNKVKNVKDFLKFLFHHLCILDIYKSPAL